MAHLFRFIDAAEPSAQLVLQARDYARLELVDGSYTTVHAGNKRTVVHVRPDERTPAGTLTLGREQLERLYLSSDAAKKFNYRLHANADGTLRVGPIIGILVGRSRSEIRKNRHGYAVFNAPWNVLAMGGLAYFFTLEDIDWERRRVFGHVHFYDGAPIERPPAKLVFTTGYFPFPDAIYRRRFIPYDVLDKVRREMTPHIFNNPRASDKLRQARALQNVGSLARHVPEVEELTSADVLNDMLRRHGQVFVKRSGLGAGRAVVHVRRHRGGGYVLTRREAPRSQREVQHVVPSFAKMVQLLVRATGYAWRSSAWGVQRAIVPARHDGRVFDLRLIIQKNGFGRWCANGAYVRLAPTPQSVVTRLGDYVQADDFLQNKWPDKGSSLLQTVKDFALRCGAVFDDHWPILGDLGVDILVDEDGKHWFLEANVGPGYLRVGEEDDGYWHQIAAPLTFASFLAGFSVKSQLARVTPVHRNDA